MRDALSKAVVSKKRPAATKKPGTAASPGATKKPEATVSPGGESPSGAFPYPDGTYTGTGEGYGGPITVKIEIKDKALKSVSVTSHDGEDNGFFQRAQSLTEVIVKSQSVEVDGVSGATYSSKGILEAVKNALEAAGNSGASETPTPTGTPSPTKTPSVTETPAPAETPGGSVSVYKDGAYSASALCSPDGYGDFDPYNLNLTVVLEGGKITAIRNIYGDYGDDEAENDSFVSRAAEGTLSLPGVVGQILAKNSTEGIDAVSHATCSSHAIIEACRQALEKAKN